MNIPFATLALWNIIIPKHLLLSRFISSLFGKVLQRRSFPVFMAGLCWTRTKSGVCWRISFEDLVGTCDCTFLPDWAHLQTTYSRLTQRWHYSGSRRPVTGMRWPVSACLRIFIYRSPPKRRIFLKLGDIASQALVVIAYWRALIELGRSLFRLEYDCLSSLANRVSLAIAS